MFVYCNVIIQIQFSACRSDIDESVSRWHCEIVPLTATEKDEELTPKRQTVVSKHGAVSVTVSRLFRDYRTAAKRLTSLCSSPANLTTRPARLSLRQPAGLVSRARSRTDNGVFSRSQVHLTLSLILSALSGSAPPPPRFLSSVIFLSFLRRDVNVSHKPTPRGGRESGRQSALRVRVFSAGLISRCRSRRSASLKVSQCCCTAPQTLPTPLRVFVYDRNPYSPPTADKLTEQGQTTFCRDFQNKRST